MAEQGFFAFEDEKSIDEKFATFCELHPDVLDLFRKFSEQLRRAGRKNAGAKQIVERIRWERMTSAHGSDEDYAINNNYTSRLARWLIEQDPSFSGFFEMRRLRS